MCDFFAECTLESLFLLDHHDRPKREPRGFPPEFLTAIETTFVSLEEFKNAFVSAGVARFRNRAGYG